MTFSKMDLLNASKRSSCREKARYPVSSKEHSAVCPHEDRFRSMADSSKLSICKGDRKLLVSITRILNRNLNPKVQDLHIANSVL